MPNMIDRIAGKLHKYGWIKGNYGTAVVGYCLMGAKDAVVCDIMRDAMIGGHPLHRGIEVVALHEKLDRTLIRAVRGVSGDHDVVRFNDDATTTWEDVQLVLKHASQSWDANHYEPAIGPSSEPTCDQKTSSHQLSPLTHAISYSIPTSGIPSITAWGMPGAAVSNAPVAQPSSCTGATNGTSGHGETGPPRGTD